MTREIGTFTGMITVSPDGSIGYREAMNQINPDGTQTPDFGDMWAELAANERALLTNFINSRAAIQKGKPPVSRPTAFAAPLDNRLKTKGGTVTSDPDFKFLGIPLGRLGAPIAKAFGNQTDAERNAGGNGA